MNAPEVKISGDRVLLYAEGYAEPLTANEAFALARDLTRAADSLLGKSGWDGQSLLRESNPQTRLIDAMHERTGRCLGGEHLDCARVEQRHGEGNHSDCLPVEDGKADPTFTGGGAMEGSLDLAQFAHPDGPPIPGATCPSTRPFDDPDRCVQPHGHRGPHRAGLGTEVWRDGQTRSILDRSPRQDGRRADWDALTPDQKVQARLDGSEYVPLTLEQRVERLERHVVEIESRPNPYDVIRGMDGR